MVVEARSNGTAKHSEEARAAALSAVVAAGGTALGAGKLIQENPWFPGTWNADIPPPDESKEWRAAFLDEATLDKISVRDALRYLMALNPDVSAALWVYLRLCNPGWEAKAFRVAPADGRTEQPDARAQDAVHAIIGRVTALYGSFDVVINRLFIGAWAGGAFLSEAVLGPGARQMIDYATPDPAVVRFRRRRDPDRGQVWEMGQYQVTPNPRARRPSSGGAGNWVPLERPTISYLPIDPPPGSPYGRAVANPCIFPALFLLAILNDLRRVIQQQGYPRIDISVFTDAIAQHMSPEDASDPEKWAAAVNGAIKQVVDGYTKLKPESAYVHTNAITVNRPVGTVDASSLGAMEAIFDELHRQVARALKTMPILMGIKDASSEADANRQWEIQAAGVKSLQHLAEAQIGRMLEVGLRAEGIIARVEFQFAELRVAELVRDAQVEWLKLRSALAKAVVGFESPDSAAQAATGHDLPTGNGVEPWDKDTALAVLGAKGTASGGGASGANPGTVNPDPGSQKEHGPLLLRALEAAVASGAIPRADADRARAFLLAVAA